MPEPPGRKKVRQGGIVRENLPTPNVKHPNLCMCFQLFRGIKGNFSCKSTFITGPLLVLVVVCRVQYENGIIMFQCMDVWVFLGFFLSTQLIQCLKDQKEKGTMADIKDPSNS